MSRDFDMIAKTFQGFEEILAKEIESLGGKNIEILKRAVAFSGDKKLLYRCNYESRLALSILVPIFSFDAKTVDDIYNGVKRIDWNEFMTVKQTFSIHATINSETFQHSRFVVLKVKDAIADQFREKTEERPDVDTENPHLKIQVHIFKEEVTVLLDSSGDALFKRGYRKRTGEAHLNEVLAAGLIKLSGWDGKSPLIDPMCGSGTILTEAGMMITQTPAGKYRREFGFTKWNDFEKELFEEVKSTADKKIRNSETPLTGFDTDSNAVESARINLSFLEGLITFSIVQTDMLRMKAPYSSGFLIVNPPYGERLRTGNEVQLYGEIGTVLKHNYAGYKAWIISSNPEAIKNIGLKPSKKYVVFNGPLECRFLGFDLYEGSKKKSG